MSASCPPSSSYAGALILHQINLLKEEHSTHKGSDDKINDNKTEVTIGVVTDVIV